MKQSCIVTLALIAALAILANTQSPYDPTKQYNVTYIQWWPYNNSLLRLCQTPVPDGTYCQRCKPGATRQDHVVNGVIRKYGICMFDFLPDDCYAYDLNLNCVLCHDGFWMNTSQTNDRNLCKPKTYGCQVYDSTAKKCKTCMPGWTMNTTVNGASNLTEYFCYFLPDVNCVKYDADNICQGCVSNYAVVKNVCVKWVANCATMNGNVCSKCNINYELDSTEKCVAIPKITNCVSQIDYKCSSCLTGFNLVNNQCVAAITIPNCAQISGSVCARCNSGYYLTNEGECALVPPIANCRNQLSFTCLSCISGYALANNACVYMIPDCTQVIGTVCTKCNINFQITIDGKCASIPKINNCDIQLDYTCQSCTDGWALSNNQCTYIIDKCALVNGMVCQKCNTDYSITLDGKCEYIRRIPNCDLQADFTCSVCAPGFALFDNACSYIIDNCDQVEGMTCAQCDSEYAITSNGKCELIPKIQNCDSQIDFTCQSCLTGFILFQNQCIPVTQNCLQYTARSCSKCITDYQLTASYTCQFIPRIPNCLNQIDTECMECSSGYNLLSNVCVFIIENCLKVSGTVCEKCSEGYVIESDGKCAHDPFSDLDPNCRLYDMTTFNKCLVCSGGFFLNDMKKCEHVDPLCRTFNGKNGFCLSCYVGYTLDNARGKCIKASSLASEPTEMDYCNQYDWTRNVCVKCAEGCYFDAQGKCQKYTDQNCKTPSADLKSCAKCYQGYTFNQTQGKCIIANFNCASWSNGKCATCPKGYYLDDKSECIMIDPFCYIFNKVIKRCVICYPGYVWDSQRKCKSVNDLTPELAKYSQNCSKFVGEKCTECYFGFYVANDDVGSYCAKVSDSCKSYNKLTGKCTSCYMGYYRSAQGECLRFF